MLEATIECGYSGPRWPKIWWSFNSVPSGRANGASLPIHQARRTRLMRSKAQRPGSRSALLWSTRPRVRGAARIWGGFRFLPLLGFGARRQAHAFLQHSQIVVDPLTNDSGGLRSRLRRQFRQIARILDRDLESLPGVFALLGDDFLGTSGRMEVLDHRRGLIEGRMDDLALFFSKRFGPFPCDRC